uniref:hypothetical protein n=1 Tax=Thaumasiovibrio occultus TaxID=1891184 RepID=UPI00131B1D80|nr:hypothetical protein [Thaumasiovibrio occultus]
MSRAADDTAKFLTTTHLGLGILNYMLFATTTWLAVLLLEGDVGILSFLIVPLALVLCFVFLLVTLSSALTLDDILVRFAYPAVIAYLSIPSLHDSGLFGPSLETSKIAAGIFAIIGFVILNVMASSPKILQRMRQVATVIGFIVLLLQMKTAGLKILVAAGWI